ncbi:MAG: MDR family MFS transporter [Acidimicrobiales bacterium]
MAQSLERFRARAHVIAVVYAVAMFASVMDTQIVNVALTSLSRDFHVTDSSVQWVITSYMMSLAICIPASGWLGDRVGTKRVFLAAVVVFTVASGLCAASVSMSELIFMRVLQGAGAGMMVPVGMAIVYRAYPRERRVDATRLITRVMVLAPASAPLIGGALVTWASWRWIFTINLPIGAAVVVGGALLLEEHREPPEGSFDLYGTVSGVLGVGLFLYAVGSGPTAGWTSPEVLATGLGALCALAFFVRVELRRDHPLLDLRILTDRLFRWCSISNMLAMWAFFGALVFTALYVQEARGYSAMVSGLTTFPEAVAIGLVTGVVARLYRRVGARPLVLVGFVGLAAANGLLALSGATTSLWLVRGLCALLGLSVAFIMLSSQTAAFARISMSATGHASAIFNTVQRVSMSIGVAFLAAVLAFGGGDVVHARPPVSAFRWVFAANMIVALVGAALSSRVPDVDVEVTPARPVEGTNVTEGTGASRGAMRPLR